MDFINPNLLSVTEAFIEPSLASAKKGDSFQFQRLGYFNVDDDTTSKKLFLIKQLDCAILGERKNLFKNKQIAITNVGFTL